MNIPTYHGELPYLTTAQMVEVDRAMMEDYRIELIQMMENAGRSRAHDVAPDLPCVAPGSPIMRSFLQLNSIPQQYPTTA